MTKIYTAGNIGPRLVIAQLLGGPTHAVGNYAHPGARLIASINPTSLDASKALEYGSGSSADGVENKTMSGGFWTNLPFDEPQDKFPTHNLQLRWADGIRDTGAVTPFAVALQMVKEWASKLPMFETGAGEKPPTVPWLKCLFQGSESTYKVYGQIVGFRQNVTEIRYNGDTYVPKSGTIEIEFLEIPAIRAGDL